MSFYQNEWTGLLGWLKRTGTFVFAGLLLICSFLSGNMTYTPKEAYAQSAATPFVLDVEVYVYRDNPDGRLAHKMVTARRSDGSTTLNENVGPLEWGLMGRKIMFSDGRTISTIDSLGTKTTWPMTQRNTQTSPKGALAGPIQNCTGKNETFIGYSTVSNQDVAIVRQPLLRGLQTPDAPARVTDWRALSLGCQVLEYQVEQAEAQGAWQLVTKSKVVSLTLGEPDPQYFNVPATLTELKPSDVQHKILQRVGMPEDEAEKKSATRLDEKYAGHK
jgi:hypothetical protein